MRAPALSVIVPVYNEAATIAAVLDAVGRTVWQQPTTEAGQPLLALPATPALAGAAHIAPSSLLSTA